MIDISLPKDSAQFYRLPNRKFRLLINTKIMDGLKCKTKKILHKFLPSVSYGGSGGAIITDSTILWLNKVLVSQCVKRPALKIALRLSLIKDQRQLFPNAVESSYRHVFGQFSLIEQHRETSTMLYTSSNQWLSCSKKITSVQKGYCAPSLNLAN